MASTFTISNDGLIEVALPEASRDLERALNDCVSSRPPAGSDAQGRLSTFWIDRVLSLIRKNDGNAVELAAGNMSHVILDGQTVRVIADYDTHDDIEVPVFWVEALLEQWRSRVIEAASTRPDAYEDDERPGRRAYASLRIFTSELSPAALTQVLECEPTSTYAIGDPVGRLAGRRTTNGWFLDSNAAELGSEELGRHIDWLLDSVNDAELVSLQGEHRALTDIFCYWEAAQGGPEFHPGLLSRLARHGLGLVLGSLHVGEPESERP